MLLIPSQIQRRNTVIIWIKNPFERYSAIQWQIAVSATFEIFHFILFIEHVYQQLTNDPISGQKSSAIPEI